jgi:benzoyl-CoA reductase subunit C
VSDWQELELEPLLQWARELVENPDFPTVHQWKAGGGKVLGHFQVYFPEEIAHAAGMLPVKVRGAQLEARQAGSRFGSYLCSILKTSLEVALTGRLPLDMFVTHPICDSARNLAGIFGRNLEVPAQILYLPQNANSAYAPVYLAEEYRRLGQDVSQMCGHPIEDQALRDSISVYNQSRRLMRSLYQLKREEPWRVAVDEAYALIALSGLLPRHHYNRLLEKALPMLHQRSATRRDMIRVVWDGGFCEQPPIDMLRVVARSCYVVDDDLLIGQRYLLEDVPEDGDPWLALAESYLHRSSWCAVQHDLRKPKEAMLLERIRNSGAQAAIITAAKMCEPGLDEQVAYSKALDEAGIPYFISEFEEQMSGFEGLQIQLETFAENLLFD